MAGISAGGGRGLYDAYTLLGRRSPAFAAGFQAFSGFGKPEGSALMRLTSRESSQFGVRAQ